MTKHGSAWTQSDCAAPSTPSAETPADSHSLPGLRQSPLCGGDRWFLHYFLYPLTPPQPQPIGRPWVYTIPRPTLGEKGKKTLSFLFQRAPPGHLFHRLSPGKSVSRSTRGLLLIISLYVDLLGSPQRVN